MSRSGVVLLGTGKISLTLAGGSECGPSVDLGEGVYMREILWAPAHVCHTEKRGWGDSSPAH